MKDQGFCLFDTFKGNVALDRTSWSIKSVVTVCYKMHMVGKMFEK